MIEGGGSKTWSRAKKWLYCHPAESKKLLTALTDLIIEYLIRQFDAGASLLQVFDTNAGELPTRLYENFCVPDLKRIAATIKERRPAALLTVFPKDAALEPFDDSQYDVVGVQIFCRSVFSTERLSCEDFHHAGKAIRSELSHFVPSFCHINCGLLQVSWKQTPEYARRACPTKVLQGNLDPVVLYSNKDIIATETDKMMSGFGGSRHIANLGHGMLPDLTPEGLGAFLDAVKAG